ncbi:MAG: dipeptidase [Bacteroidetes bacterium]|nr:dipeptidase [Bacteroidota bacterium]
MEYIKNYIEENKQRFLDELFELIRIPSVSSLKEHKGDMVRMAEKLRDSLKDAGADKATVMETEGNPVVFAEKLTDPSLPTVLVYGHYDVMPVDPIDKWESPPFEPVIRNGKIYARGADDDKGQAFMHVKALELMIKTCTLQCNVKFIIEGEEEIGSPSLGKFCGENRELLKADVILVSDTGLLGAQIPSITTGLRGLAYLEVEVTGPDRDLHSGLFGGAVANPVNVLCDLIASMTDENKRITVPGFYDDVLEVSREERAEMAEAPFDIEEYRKSLGIDEVSGEKGYSTLERTGIRPSFDVCGIWGGYTGEGAKTVLPSKAYAKISSRLVPNQEHNKVAAQIKEYLERKAPKSVKIEVRVLHGGQGYVSPTDMVAYRAASSAFEATYGKKPVPYRSGGSIPVISVFEEKLGLKSVLMGFGLESDAIHSPNENYPLENFFKGIETISYFYHYYTEMMKEDRL